MKCSKKLKCLSSKHLPNTFMFWGSCDCFNDSFKSYDFLLNCYEGITLFNLDAELYPPGAEHLYSFRKGFLNG